MDALEFLKAAKRRYESNPDKNFSAIYLDLPDFEDYVKGVEEWAKEHPVKTRQSVFLEQFPNVRLDTNGIIDISPCRVDQKQYPFNGKDCCKFQSCGDCRRKFWAQEVE